LGYSVKEIFYSLQGEGAQSGRPAVFCRFTGCNLWSGREPDRDTAVCKFCDTDFVGTDGEGGGKFASSQLLAEAVAGFWPEAGRAGGTRLVICTGGEPTLQLDAEVVAALQARSFRVAVETNGTRPLPEGVDWICVSPKAGAPVQVRRGHELKLVFPQVGADPELFESLEFEHFFLQPMAGERLDENTKLAVDYCKRRPQWRLSLQTQKLLQIR
jgi:7-carboxy-7-deazaguanine synthase